MAKRRRVFSRTVTGLGDGADSSLFDAEYYTGATDYTPNASDVGIMQSFANDFNDALARLDAQVLALDEAETRLYAVQPIAAKNPDDLAAWQTEFNKVNAAKSTIQAAKDAAAQAGEWWRSAKSIVGMSGLRRVSMGALAVLPVAIPWGAVAIITGSVAAIAAVIASVNSLIDRLNMKAWNDENIRRSQQGLAPLPKPETSGQSIFGDFSDLGRTLTFAAIAYFLLPPLLERIKK